jgi:hypothetical protein
MTTPSHSRFESYSVVHELAYQSELPRQESASIELEPSAFYLQSLMDFGVHTTHQTLLELPADLYSLITPTTR